MSKEGTPIGHAFWEVAVNGYEVAEVYSWPQSSSHPLGMEDVIRPVDWGKDGLPARLINPYGEPDLIRDFANIKSGNESILNFANKYGLPFGSHQYVAEAPKCFKSLRSVNQGEERMKCLILKADSPTDIRKEALQVYACLTIWQALSLPTESKTLEKVRSTYEVTEDGRVEIDAPGLGRASSRMHEEPSGYSQHFEIDQSYRFLRQTVSKHLQASGATLSLLAYQRTPQSRKALRPFLTPTTLVGVIWHRLAEMIGGNEVLRRCEQCGEWFRASGKNAHLKRYCSGACRVRQHRALKSAS